MRWQRVRGEVADGVNVGGGHALVALAAAAERKDTALQGAAARFAFETVVILCVAGEVGLVIPVKRLRQRAVIFVEGGVAGLAVDVVLLHREACTARPRPAAAFSEIEALRASRVGAAEVGDYGCVFAVVATLAAEVEGEEGCGKQEQDTKADGDTDDGREGEHGVAIVGRGRGASDCGIGYGYVHGGC